MNIAISDVQAVLRVLLLTIRQPTWLCLHHSYKVKSTWWDASNLCNVLYHTYIYHISYIYHTYIYINELTIAQVKQLGSSNKLLHPSRLLPTISLLLLAWNHLFSHDDMTLGHWPTNMYWSPDPPITLVFRFPPTSPPSFSVLLVPSHPFSLLLLAWHRLLRRLLDSPSPPDVCTTGCPLIVFVQLPHYLNMNKNYSPESLGARDNNICCIKVLDRVRNIIILRGSFWKHHLYNDSNFMLVSLSRSWWREWEVGPSEWGVLWQWIPLPTPTPWSKWKFHLFTRWRPFVEA